MKMFSRFIKQWNLHKDIGNVAEIYQLIFSLIKICKAEWNEIRSLKYEFTHEKENLDHNAQTEMHK